MKKNRFFATVLTLAIFFSAMVSHTAMAAVQGTEQVKTTEALAAPKGQNNWFGSQLQGNEVIFYNALCALRDSGGLRTGMASIDLMQGDFAGEKLTSSALQAYFGGDHSLAQAFQAGRDAFAYDNADLFYVDFSKLTLRVSRSGGTYSARLGAKADGSYYKEGFSSVADVTGAISASHEAVLHIAAQAKKESGVQDKLKAAHDALAGRTSYAGGAYSGTMYGALVKGNAICEGYARAYKAVLDEMSIPCVLVGGKAGSQSHMWCKVQVSGNWLAVDPTWDDAASGVRYDYFLQGSGVFTASHTSSGILSPGGRTFQYPALAA